MADNDPSIRITLTKDSSWRSFEISPSTGWNGAWGVVETGDRNSVAFAFGRASALKSRHEMEATVTRLLADGWAPSWKPAA